MTIDTNPTGSVENMQDQAVKLGSPVILNIPTTPPIVTTSATLTADQVLGGVIACNGAAFTLTLPAAADLATGFRKYSRRGVIPGDAISFELYNFSAAVTIGTTTGASFAASGKTSIGTVASSDTIVLRFTNGAPGSEAYTIYL